MIGTVVGASVKNVPISMQLFAYSKHPIHARAQSASVLLHSLQTLFECSACITRVQILELRKLMGQKPFLDEFFCDVGNSNLDYGVGRSKLIVIVGLVKPKQQLLNKDYVIDLVFRRDKSFNSVG